MRPSYILISTFVSTVPLINTLIETGQAFIEEFELHVRSEVNVEKQTINSLINEKSLLQKKIDGLNNLLGERSSLFKLAVNNRINEEWKFIY